MSGGIDGLKVTVIIFVLSLTFFYNHYLLSRISKCEKQIIINEEIIKDHDVGIKTFINYCECKFDMYDDRINLYSKGR
jgi:hypothetical protein